MSALEKRLADTEVALAATLNALQHQAAMQLVDRHLMDATAKPSQPRESKAEKLEEWKRLPLRNYEQLAAWHQARDRETVTSERLHPEHARPVFNLDIQGSFAMHTAASQGRQTHVESPTSTTAALEQLRCCNAPMVPNARKSLSDSGRWRENYF